MQLVRYDVMIVNGVSVDIDSINYLRLDSSLSLSLFLSKYLAPYYAPFAWTS